MPLPLIELADECKEQKLCPPGPSAQMALTYFPFTGGKRKPNGYATELWGFNLANKLIQLDTDNSKAKKSQSLALAALGAL